MEAIPGFTVGGSVRVETPLLLAPMEDVTAGPMRLITKEIANPGLMFTEFISAMAIKHGAVKTLRKMRVDPAERPLGIQIFGADPDAMAESARLAEEMGADLVDINMGCWVPKVCKTGSGAAMLNDPARAAEVVRAVARAVAVPTTIKVRAGFGHGDFTAPEFVRRMVGEGARMVTLHARFAKQGHDGEADWSLIERLRAAVPDVPLVGNGDVRTGEDALKMIRRTGCDGAMMGRAAIGNPWAVRDAARALRGESPLPAPSLGERVRTAILHAERQVAHEGLEFPAIRALRGLLPMYVKGFAGAAEVRAELYRASTLAEVRAALRPLATLEPVAA